MCGLVAIWDPRGGLPPDATDPIHELTHRGPDGTGTWRSATGRAALGHTRLAIVDLDGGAQPIANEDGSVLVVATGEIYDDVRLAERLARRGHDLRTRCDSEVIVHLYEDHGDACVEHLRGEFAFVLWDERQGRLVAVRDRFGVKPLYYATVGGRLVIASEIKALFAAGVAPRWDGGAIYDFLHGILPAEHTIFDGVRQVPPGGVLTADAGGVALARYWQPTYPAACDVEAGRPWEEIAEELARSLAESVEIRLRSDVPVGCHLSGGLDSSTVVALVARQQRTTTFTVDFADARSAESDIARRTAARLGSAHHQISFSAADYLAHLDATIRAAETIQENAHGTARLLQSQAIGATGHRVVLTGDGGDELFAGYPQTQRDLDLSLRPDDLARSTSSHRKLAARSPRYLGSVLDQLGFLPAWMVQRYGAVALPARSLLGAAFTSDHDRRDCLGGVLEEQAGALSGRAPVHQGLQLFFATWFSSYLLVAERLDMAHAVESRMPLLDHELFGVARQLPLDAYRLDGRAKYPLRRAAVDLISDEVRDAPKQPFIAPATAVEDDILAGVRARVESGALDAQPAFSVSAVRTYLDRLRARPPAERLDADRTVQILNSLCVLQDQFQPEAA